MSEEIRKYNPANFTAEHLFRPPTSSTHGELTYLSEQLSQALEGGDRIKSKRLLVGTELEIFFFSQEIDPYDGSQLLSRDNPNYSKVHLEKIDRLQEFAETLKRRRPSEFMVTGKQGRIFLEFRTAPQQVCQYLKTVELLGDLLRKECRCLDVLPVVHSQHIHMSLRNNPLNIFHAFKDGAGGIIPDDEVVEDAFSRITPLMLLPEEWSERRYDSHFIKHDGIVAGSFRRNLDHPEFRMLSSEYAFDPVLNLLVSLRAMYAGCVNELTISARKYSNRYGVAVKQMGKDTELAKFFGQSTLKTLTDILRQYPLVSKRKITVDQIR